MQVCVSYGGPQLIDTFVDVNWTVSYSYSTSVLLIPNILNVRTCAYCAMKKFIQF